MKPIKLIICCGAVLSLLITGCATTAPTSSPASGALVGNADAQAGNDATRPAQAMMLGGAETLTTTRGTFNLDSRGMPDNEAIREAFLELDYQNAVQSYLWAYLTCPRFQYQCLC